jgi:TP901 family phage tail tape measure protein
MASTSVTFDILARDKASSTFRNIGDSATKSTSHIAKFGAILKKSAIGVGLLTAAAGVFVAKVGAAYVDSLNQIQALTGANDIQMKRAASTLESQSGAYAKMGQSTGDAASGVVELTKAGLSLGDALKSVRGTMTLAKAGALSVGDASSVTANALNTFHLKAKAAGDVANYLANAANISSADVSDLAESLKYVSPVAVAAGVSIKQTNAILAELANAGIKGSSAGTSFRTFLLSLQAPTAQASAIMKDLGIQVYDSTGKMKPLGDVIQEVGGKLDGLSQKEKTADLKAIFGKVGIAGATTILNEGKKGLEEYTKGVGKAGAANKLAQARTKGLGGSIAMIKSSAVSSAQSLYRHLSPIADKLIRPLAKNFADLSTKIGPGVASAVKKAGDAFGKLNIAGLGKKLATQAKSWAKPVIDGFKQGLNGGDWSGLGEALGNGIVDAINGTASLVGKMTKAFGDMMGKVNWGEIGRSAGKQVPLFLLGLATGILNFDPFPLLKFMGAHWFEVLIGILTIAFAPAKFAKPLEAILTKIPFVGRFLAVAVHWLNELGGKVKGIIADFARGFWKGFIEHASFPGASLIRNVLRGLSALPGKVAGFIKDLGATIYLKGLDAFERLGGSVGDAQAKVVGKIGGLIKGMLKPFAGAGKWLWDSGVAIIQGLINGINAKVGELMSKVSGIGGSIKSAFKKAMGIFSPSKVFRGYGNNLMDGLMQGIADREMSVQTAMSRISTLIQNAGNKISNLMSTKSGFMRTFTSDSIFGTDLTRPTLADGTRGPRGDIGTLIAAQKAQAHQAHRLNRDVKQATKMGLSKALIRQLQSQGTSGAAALHAIASGSEAEVKRLNRLNKQTSESLKSAGMRAGNYVRGGSVSADIRVAQKQEHVLELLEHHLKDLAKSEKKGQTIIVEIDSEAVIRAIHRRNKRKGVKTANV